MPALTHFLRQSFCGLLMAALVTASVACPGDGPASQTVNLGRAEARDAVWLRAAIEPLLPCRDSKSQLGCMCRPVV